MLCTQRSDPVPCLVCPLPCTDASSQHILPLCRLSSSSIAVYYILGGLHNEGRISNQTSQNLLLLGGCCRHLLACNFRNIPNKKHSEVNAYNAVEGLGRIGSVGSFRVKRKDNDGGHWSCLLLPCLVVARIPNIR